MSLFVAGFVAGALCAGVFMLWLIGSDGARRRTSCRWTDRDALYDIGIDPEDA